jgi:ketosteroid isomerase-like protein
MQTAAFQDRRVAMPTQPAPHHRLFTTRDAPIMPKAKTQAAVMGGSADDIEAAFYEALQSGDIERLMACWSDDDEIVCVHPGGPRVVGGAAIRATFDAIFANGSIRAWPEQVRRIEALASVVHNVLERVDVMTETGPANAYVLATNVYHKTAQGWRMVAHHASPGSQSEAHEINDAPQTLH